MSALFVGELFAAYCFIGALATLFAFASWDWLRDRDAERRMVVLLAAEHARDLEDAQVADLDAAWDLPAFGGWRG